jgi:hypothetical protein
MGGVVNRTPEICGGQQVQFMGTIYTVDTISSQGHGDLIVKLTTKPTHTNWNLGGASSTPSW